MAALATIEIVDYSRMASNRAAIIPTTKTRMTRKLENCISKHSNKHNETQHVKSLPVTSV